jgi:hypothetical protein
VATGSTPPAQVLPLQSALNSGALNNSGGVL